MKSRAQRLLEVIQEDIEDHIFMEREEIKLKELVEFLKTEKLPTNWQENEYLVIAREDIHDICVEFGV